jgi:hypothetical protein
LEQRNQAPFPAGVINPAFGALQIITGEQPMSERNGTPDPSSNGEEKPKPRRIFTLVKITGKETDEELERIAERMAEIL